MNNSNTQQESNKFLVIGGTGKTGRRVIERLESRGIKVRNGSRSAAIPFDWEDSATWTAVLQNMTHVYVTFYPDLAVPGAPEAIQMFTDLAVKSGVKRLVLLSGRGEEEAQKCEQIVQQSGIEWTILRASWFSQNFSEGFLRDLVIHGEIALPVASVREPFIDVEDIADVAVAALTEEGHAGELYELAGPRLLSFDDAVGEIASAVGYRVKFTPIPLDVFSSALKAQGMTNDYIALLSYLLTTVLDGRNEHLTDGVQRALGRPPRDFSEYVAQTAAVGAWQDEVVMA